MKPDIAAAICLFALSVLAQHPGADRDSENAPLNIGYNPNLAAQQARRLSSHSWEFGTLSEALLEYYNASLSVFSRSAFPSNRIPVVPVSHVPSLTYAKPNIRTNNVTLIDGDGAAGDPCSLGVSAELIGRTSEPYAAAAARQATHLLTQVPRWPNGAISHREAYAELWADFVYMAPPFLAYHAVATSNTTLLRVAADQCLLYGQVLRNVSSTGGAAWRHIAGPPSPDPGLWSTGNGWAAMGMARVLATAMHWEPTACGTADVQAGLLREIGGILEGAAGVRGNREPASGLIRNYLNDTSWFGETSGTAALTAATYRVAVLQEEWKGRQCPGTYGAAAAGGNDSRPVTPGLLAWADANRQAIARHVNGSGIAAPAVNPLGWGDRTPYTAGSPEGESFLVLLYSAWRDCVGAGVCQRN